MDLHILFATALAGYLYAIAPGPTFLALFTLVASKGQGAGARFVGGHLAGDVTWGALAVAAIVGANRLGPALFAVLGLCCGVYLIYLGARAFATRDDAAPRTIGAERPLLTGVVFGLTNPKAYPVALAMFSAIVAPYVNDLRLANAPPMMGAAFLGFVLADATLILAAGLPVVRRFFLRYGAIVTRAVGLLFIAFGARAALDGAATLARR